MTYESIAARRKEDEAKNTSVKSKALERKKNEQLSKDQFVENIMKRNASMKGRMSLSK